MRRSAPNRRIGRAAADDQRSRPSPDRSTESRRWRRLTALLLAAASLAVGAWYASLPRAVAVRTTPIVVAYPSQQFAMLTASARVVAPRKVAVAAKVSGRLEWLGVAEGSRVRAGEVIARIQPRSDAATPRGPGRSDDSLVRAPFDGVIVSTGAAVGDRVTPFASTADSRSAVVHIADTSALEVEARVPTPGLASVRVGQPCEITLDALPDARLRGTVAQIVPALDRYRASVMTKVRLDDADPRVLPDMDGSVSFLSRPITAEQQKPVAAVRLRALGLRAGRTVIFVVRGGRVAVVDVAAGQTLGELTSIVGAVTAGEQAVLDPAPELGPDARVRIVANRRAGSGPPPR